MCYYSFSSLSIHYIKKKGNELDRFSKGNTAIARSGHKSGGQPLFRAIVPFIESKARDRVTGERRIEQNGGEESTVAGLILNRGLEQMMERALRQL